MCLQFWVANTSEYRDEKMILCKLNQFEGMFRESWKIILANFECTSYTMKQSYIFLTLEPNKGNHTATTTTNQVFITK